MKNELLSILCMTLICATLMLGIMGIYRMVGSSQTKKRMVGNSPVHTVTDTLTGPEASARSIFD